MKNIEESIDSLFYNDFDAISWVLLPGINFKKELIPTLKYSTQDKLRYNRRIKSHPDYNNFIIDWKPIIYYRLGSCSLLQVSRSTGSSPSAVSAGLLGAFMKTDNIIELIKFSLYAFWFFRNNIKPSDALNKPADI